jgi:quinol monooxygenase YgiN
VRCGRRPHGESHRTLKDTESAFSLCVSVELMGFHSYIVAASFHTRADAIDAMKQVVAEVTAPSLDKEGCQIYQWSQGADDPTLFLLYIEWRDKACFEAHIATPHVKHAEDRLKREKMLIEPGERMAPLSTLESTSRRGRPQR